MSRTRSKSPTPEPPAQERFADAYLNNANRIAVDRLLDPLIRENYLDVATDKAINRIAHRLLSKLCSQNGQWAQIAYEELPDACKKYVSLCRHIKRKVLEKRTSPAPETQAQTSLADCQSDQSRLPSDLDEDEQAGDDAQSHNSG
jgi:hypothetical protein